MVVKHECPHCRQDIWVRKALDNKHYIWDMNRAQEIKEGFIPFDDLEELKQFYRQYRRKSNEFEAGDPNVARKFPPPNLGAPLESERIERPKGHDQTNTHTEENTG